MSDTWSGSITFTGLGSGTDWDSIIEATMEVESYRKDQMESWQSDWEEKVTALQELNQGLIDLDDWLTRYDTPEEFLIKTATSTDTDAVAVSAAAEAEEGSHTVIVNQLAQNDIIMATGTTITTPGPR
jgi:flagellar hook-associated protein 2